LVVTRGELWAMGYEIECDASGKTLGIYLEHGERIGNIISN